MSLDPRRILLFLALILTVSLPATAQNTETLRLADLHPLAGRLVTHHLSRQHAITLTAHMAVTFDRQHCPAQCNAGLRAGVCWCGWGAAQSCPPNTTQDGARPSQAGFECHAGTSAARVSGTGLPAGGVDIRW